MRSNNMKEERTGATRRNSRPLTLRIAYMALMMALIFAATALITFQAGHGYLHFGDGMIFASVFLLGPWGIVSAGLGSALADVWAGFVLYAPATLVIKSLMAMVFWFFVRRKKESAVAKYVGMALAECLMALGYFAYETALYGVEGAIAGIVPNILQGGFGIVAGGVLMHVLARSLGTKAD